MPRETAILGVPENPATSETDTPTPKTGRKPRRSTATKRRTSRPRISRKNTPIVPLTAMRGASLGYQMMAVAHRYAVTLDKALNKTPATRGITVPQLQTLQLMAVNPDSCGADLARALGVQPQTMTSVLGSLRRQGLIVNLAHVSGQGRALALALTAEGKEMLQQGRKVARKVDRKLAQAYSHDGREVEVLADLLMLGGLALTPPAR
jgi:DNA-binding MarR family transcriptional regulator